MEASLADEKVKEATWSMYRLAASGREAVEGVVKERAFS